MLAPRCANVIVLVVILRNAVSAAVCVGFYSAMEDTAHLITKLQVRKFFLDSIIIIIILLYFF